LFMFGKDVGVAAQEDQVLKTIQKGLPEVA